MSDLIGYKLTEVGTTELFEQGKEISVPNGNVYKYVKASGTVAASDAVLIEDDFTVAALTTTNAGSAPTWVGIAQAAMTANQFGWVLISGTGTVNVLASCATDVKLYTTATAGALDDTATTLVSGIKISATNGGATAAVACFIATRAGCNMQ
jgi:hypothetical protein